MPSGCWRLTWLKSEYTGRQNHADRTGQCVFHGKCLTLSSMATFIWQNHNKPAKIIFAPATGLNCYAFHIMAVNNAHPVIMDNFPKSYSKCCASISSRAFFYCVRLTCTHSAHPIRIQLLLQTAVFIIHYITLSCALICKSVVFYCLTQVRRKMYLYSKNALDDAINLTRYLAAMITR